MIGTTELLLIFCVALLLFGGKRLPQLAKSLGEAIAIFREGMHTSAHTQAQDNRGTTEATASQESAHSPREPLSQRPASDARENDSTGEKSTGENTDADSQD